MSFLQGENAPPRRSRNDSGGAGGRCQAKCGQVQPPGFLARAWRGRGRLQCPEQAAAIWQQGSWSMAGVQTSPRKARYAGSRVGRLVAWLSGVYVALLLIVWL